MIRRRHKYNPAYDGPRFAYLRRVVRFRRYHEELEQMEYERRNQFPPKWYELPISDVARSLVRVAR